MKDPFGCSEQRKKIHRRDLNSVMPITEDYVGDYNKNKGVVMDTKVVRTKAGVDKQKLSTVVASKIAIDIAVVVKIVSNTKNNDIENSEESATIQATPPMPPLKKKSKVSYLYIPRLLEVHVLNPVMTMKNNRECSVAYTT